MMGGRFGLNFLILKLHKIGSPKRWCSVFSCFPDPQIPQTDRKMMLTPRFAEISYVFTEKIQSDASRFVVEGVSHNFRSLGRLFGGKIHFSYGIPHGMSIWVNFITTSRRSPAWNHDHQGFYRGEKKKKQMAELFSLVTYF